VIRVAAVGDIHVGTDSAGALRPHLERLPELADVLLLAGDLSRLGRLDEAETLCRELRGVAVPVVAVLGNHDHESDLQDEFRAVIEQAGVTVLEGEHTVIDVGGCRVGIAGTIGFAGGFPGRSCADFGEREMKAFMARAKHTAHSLEQALQTLDADLRIALTHYSPVAETLVGEPPEIHAFLGCYLLAEAIDRAGADIAFHGHAHHGVEKGRTPGGVPVRNVAQPVIRHPYNVYRLRPSGEVVEVDDADALVASGH
jgi:Icc-related predicted phosphoesterase